MSGQDKHPFDPPGAGGVDAPIRSAAMNLLRWQAPAWAAWATGALTLALALAASAMFTETLAGCQALPLVAALLLTSLIGGWGPAVTIGVCGAIVLWVNLSPPVEQVHRIRVLISIGVPVLAACGGVAVIELLRAALASLAEERKRVTALTEAQLLLFSELQHRVANNMQFISSLLTLHSRRVTSAEDGRRALLDARQRLDVMSRIHRRLTTPLAKGDDLAQMIEDVCRDLLAATGATNIVCRVDMAAVELPLDRVSALALIVTELFTNALKHAFVGRAGGTIAVTLQPTAIGHYVLEVRDDGVGLQRTPECDTLDRRPPAGAMQGMGTRVIESLARRLDGRFSLSAGLCGEPGTVARLEFVA